MKKLLAISLITLCSFAPTRYELPCNEIVIIESLKLAQSQVGVAELTGNNDGKAVEGYLRSVNLKKGNPYCAAFQYWSFDSTVKKLNLPHYENPLPKTGSTVAMFDYAIKHGMKTKAVPEVYDLVFWKYDNRYSGHVERIDSIGNYGNVFTVAANTSGDSKGSQRDGGGVYAKKRNVKSRLGAMLVRGYIGFKDE